MKKTLLLVLAVLFLIYDSPGQEEKGASMCSQKKSSASHLPILGDPGSPGSPRHSFDVLNYRLYLDIYNCFLSPYPKSFIAHEVVTFRVDSMLNVIRLNAVNSSLVIDSVGMAGVSFAHASNILTITLDRVYNPGEVVDAKVSFKHNNVTDNAFYVSNGMVFTDCEPEGARKWFPCWDRPSDKATLDLTAKVPATVKLGSNGRLADSTQVADTIYYNWISRDPIATYLVVMSAKVNYNLDIVHWRTLSNPNDSIPIRFYWNSGESGLANIKAKISPMTTQFSLLFGEHPFEKNGFATLNSQFAWGGMENQTLTSLCPNCWGENLVSHEYAHQWFGDMITCATWADIWLNEGFATYLEALWYEYTSGYNAYKSDINSDASSYLGGNPGWPIYNPSWAVTTPPNSTLFNYAITYAKGACVLHMLRYTLGDSLFFAAIKTYATDTTNFKHKTAVTADFLSALNQSAGQDMTWFIDQWVYQPNHPVYANTYNITSIGAGTWMVGFRARQTQTNTVFFTMPMELRITFVSGPDTLIRVTNTTNDQTFGFTFNRQPVGLQFDPNNNIVLKQGSTTIGQTLAAPVLVFPQNNSVNQPRTVDLLWSATISAATYRVQVATDSLFNTVVFNDSTLTDTTTQVGVLAGNTKHYWRVNSRNAGGVGPWSTVWNFTTGISTDLAGAEGRPQEFSLSQNYPNPFNPTTMIRYDLPVTSEVQLSVFNVLGQVITTLVREKQKAGRYEIEFDGQSLASGIYFYRLEATSASEQMAGYIATRKFVLIK